MNALIFFIVLAAALALQFLVIYFSYLPVSRRHASQKQLLHASFVVMGYSMMAGVLLKLAELPRSIGVLITAILIHMMGRRILSQSNKQAWASCGIFITLILVIAAGFIYLMETNDAFRAIMMQKAE